MMDTVSCSSSHMMMVEPYTGPRVSARSWVFSPHSTSWMICVSVCSRHILASVLDFQGTSASLSELELQPCFGGKKQHHPSHSFQKTWCMSETFYVEENSCLFTRDTLLVLSVTRTTTLLCEIHLHTHRTCLKNIFHLSAGMTTGHSYKGLCCRWQPSICGGSNLLWIHWHV